MLPRSTSGNVDGPVARRPGDDHRDDDLRAAGTRDSRRLGQRSQLSLAVVVVIAAMVSGGALWKVFHSVRYVLWFLLAGLVVWAGLLVAR
jgi:hypothetical protein